MENTNMFENVHIGTRFKARNGKIVVYSGKPNYVIIENLEGSYDCNNDGTVNTKNTPYALSEWDLVERLD